MRVGIAPKGTKLEDVGAWEYLEVEGVSIKQDEPNRWYSRDGLTRLVPTARTTVLTLKDGRELNVPPGICWRIENPNFAKGGLIVDGSITADKISAGTIPIHRMPAGTILLPSKEDTLTLDKSFYTGNAGQSIELSHHAVGEYAHSVVKVTGSGAYAYSTTAASALKGKKDHSFLALQLLRVIGASKPADISTETLDGRTTISVGNAKVYRAENEGEALRNLNFAIANLKSYLYWITDGIKAKAQRDADLKRAEERAAKERAEAEAKAAEERRLNDKARKLYNAANGLTPSAPWPFMMGLTRKQKWIDLAKQAEAITAPIIPAPLPDFAKIAEDMNRAFGSIPYYRTTNRPTVRPYGL